MFLSKIELELSNPGIRAALQDAQKMHCLVTGLFQCARKEAEVLYCSQVKGMTVELYLYSTRPIDQNRILPGMSLVGQRDIGSWADSIKAGDIFRFRLLTAPFRKAAEDGAKNSRRRGLRTVEERIAWLVRKAEQNGFRLLSAEEASDSKVTARHPDSQGGSLIVNTYCYTGTLQILDADIFRRALQTGIGPYKAYGLGMLILKGV